GARFDSAAADANFERYVVCHEHGGATVHRVDDGQVIAQLATPPGGGANATFSPDGRFLSVQISSGAFLWDLREPASLARTNFPPMRAALRTVAFSPDSRVFAVAAKDGFVHFYNLADGAERPALNVGVAAYGIAFDPSGERLALMAGNEVSVWNLA